MQFCSADGHPGDSGAERKGEGEAVEVCRAVMWCCWREGGCRGGRGGVGVDISLGSSAPQTPVLTMQCLRSTSVHLTSICQASSSRARFRSRSLRLQRLYPSVFPPARFSLSRFFLGSLKRISSPVNLIHFLRHLARRSLHNTTRLGCRLLPAPEPPLSSSDRLPAHRPRDRPSEEWRLLTT